MILSPRFTASVTLSGAQGKLTFDKSSDALALDLVRFFVGPHGLSAYQVAVSGGFVGTEAEWLASLKGDPSESVEMLWNSTNW